METQQDILINMVEAIKTDVINSMQSHDRVASGNTIKALEVVASGEKVLLTAPPYIKALELGRKPTSPDAVKHDPTLLQRIEQWVIDRGIDEKAAYAITQNIHDRGYPGKPGVLTEPLSEDNVDKRATEAAGKLANLLLIDIINL